MPTATNPKTGEKVELRDGKWVPVGTRGLVDVVRQETGAPAKVHWTQEVKGAMANLNRGLIGGDELAAVLDASGDALSGKGFDLKRSMADQRATEDEFAARHPKIAALMRGTGSAATMAIPSGGTAQAMMNSGRAMNAARGAVTAGSTAAVNGLLDRGTPGERLTAASEAAINPVNLALGGLLGAAAGKGALKYDPKPKVAPKSNVRTLKEAGVNLTPGQALSEVPVVGGLLKSTENVAQRAPILGPAIRGARERGMDSLQRGVALKALAPIGEKLPTDVKPGFDTIKFVEDKIGAVYQRAADMVPSAALDKPFADDMARIATQKGDLPESLAGTFDRIMNDRLKRLGTGASGKDIKGIHAELGKLQREYAAKGETTMAEMLGESRRAIMGLIERADPEAAALIAKADEAYGIYKIANKAAASAKEGRFNANQLASQVKSAGNKQGVNVVGKGEARLQDISAAASAVMPDEFGNPGTADALGLGGLGGLIATNPMAGAATAGGFAAAATPYFIMGRKVLDELPPNAGSVEVQRAAKMLEQLARTDPAVQKLQAELAARSARAVGLLGNPQPAGQAISPQ